MGISVPAETVTNCDRFFISSDPFPVISLNVSMQNIDKMLISVIVQSVKKSAGEDDMQETKESLVKAVAEQIPEVLEERSDPLVSIVHISTFGFGTQLDAHLNFEHCGSYRVRRAVKIVKEIEKRGHRNFLLRC